MLELLLEYSITSHYRRLGSLAAMTS